MFVKNVLFMYEPDI